MALRLGEYVEYGELDNRLRNSTTGWLKLRGERDVALVELTGDMSPDLAGKRIRFTCSKNEYKSVERLSAKGQGFPMRLIGATGTMTADRHVRLFDCPIEEFLQRSKLGEPPPTFWKRCLNLEWHGTGGRGLVEIPDAEIWSVEDTDEGVAMIPLPDDFEEPFDPNDPPKVDPEAIQVTAVTIDDEGSAWMASSDTDAEPEIELSSDDPYALFSDDFKNLIRGEEDDGPEARPAADFMAEMERMEQIWEGGEEGDRIFNVIGPGPDWRTLNDEEVESLFKIAVGKLALINVAIHVCEHYTVREACRWLFEDLADCEVHPQMAGGTWFSHFSISDDCPRCDEDW